jgi:hypothetical protein
MRTEAEIFAELKAVCQSDGYVHALAYLCFRDNIIRYADELRAEDMRHMFTPERLIRTEISTLIGLMIQADGNWTMPSPQAVEQHIERTESLLKELHGTFLGPMREAIAQHMKAPDVGSSPLTRGDLLREAIFYSGESAYSFQYRDFAVPKYASDDGWLRTKKDFTIAEAQAVVNAIGRLQEQKLLARVDQMRLLPPDQWTILPAYSFSADEVVEKCGLSLATVASVLEAFSLPAGEKNNQFQALNDFNAANALPLLRHDGNFILLQAYSLVEALYDSPFYWMAADRPYAPTALQNRGRFTEAFCRDRLEAVFGKDRVYANVDIFESKAKKAGEIDVLVLFGNRAIVVQAKSKRLTLEARKGNDGQIRDDFKKSVQDSYDQGLLCAKALGNTAVDFVLPDGGKLKVARDLKEIYILCAVSDHYPALQFQSRQFLKYERTDLIQPPLVLDVFALDAMVEMLSSPLRFLSYINRRAAYAERITATHEHIILSYHLRHNLWVEDDLNMVWLGDDISADLDVAMAVRRDGVRGQRMPEGYVSRMSATALGELVAAIDANPEPAVVDLGFLLLALSSDAISNMSRGIKQIGTLARRDGQTHDLTIALDKAQSGITVHCTDGPVHNASSRLRDHCTRRKYAQKAKTWYGICLHPSDASLRFGLKLDYAWDQNERMDELTRDMPTGGNPADAVTTLPRKAKLGRNDPCPCGSGLKFKKCHGA